MPPCEIQAGAHAMPPPMPPPIARELAKVRPLMPVLLKRLPVRVEALVVVRPLRVAVAVVAPVPRLGGARRGVQRSCW